MEQQTVRVSDGRDVAVHWSGATAPDTPVLVLHYGTPHTGNHPPRLAQLASDLGLRLLAVTRPGFPGSARRRGRTVAQAASDVVEVLDRCGVGEVATAGYSGGGPHALALAALLPDRVRAVAAFACPAPYDQTESWFADMAGDGGGLRAAADGDPARELHQRTATFDASSFTEADWAALAERWSGIGADAEAANGAGSDAGEIDDDLAFVRPWGVPLDQITGAITLYQATADRIIPAHHVERLGALLPSAEVHLVEGSGHVAILDYLPSWMGTIGAAPSRQ